MDRPQSLPNQHVDFITKCKLFHEDNSHIYVHANYWPNRPMAEQPTGSLLWEDLDPACQRHGLATPGGTFGDTGVGGGLGLPNLPPPPGPPQRTAHEIVKPQRIR